MNERDEVQEEIRSHVRAWIETQGHKSLVQAARAIGKERTFFHHIFNPRYGIGLTRFDHMVKAHIDFPPDMRDRLEDSMKPAREVGRPRGVSVAAISSILAREW